MNVDYATLKALVGLCEAHNAMAPDCITLTVGAADERQEATLTAVWHDCRDNGPPFISRVMLVHSSPSGKTRPIGEATIAGYDE